MNWVRRMPEWRDAEGAGGFGRRATPSASPAATGVDHLLAELGTLLHGLLAASREFGRAGVRVRDSVAGVADALGDAWQVTRHHGGDAVGTVTHVVERRPYVAIGLAAALGVLAGLAIHSMLADESRASDDGDDGWDHFV